MYKPNEGMVLLNALRQLKPTLTALDIRFICTNVKVTIADLLFCCPGLRKLVFYSLGSFDSVLGNMEILGESRHKLVDVDFETRLFDESLVKFLKSFPNIRKLSLKRGCVPENLDEVVEYCPNLEIFGYYFSYGETDFREQSNHQEPYYYNSSSGGITEIFTRENGYGVPAANFIRLVRKNANSLRRLHANMSMTAEQRLAGEPFAPQYPDYPNWQYTQLEHLTYYSDIYKATETVFRQALEFCTSLKELNLVDVSDLHKFVDTLITLPQLEAFSLSNIMDADGGDQALIKLFRAYADSDYMLPVTATSSSSLPAFQQRKKFNKFTCNYCSDIITDDVLDTLSGLETIKILEFSGTWTIPSGSSLQNCLNKMRNQLVEITLRNIDHVDDNTLEILSKMDQLETVYMRDLENITPSGVTTLVDNAKSLRNISVLRCPQISKMPLTYIKAKVKFSRT